MKNGKPVYLNLTIPGSNSRTYFRSAFQTRLQTKELSCESGGRRRRWFGLGLPSVGLQADDFIHDVGADADAPESLFSNGKRSGENPRKRASYARRDQTFST
jgi:hypothetical protein